MEPVLRRLALIAPVLLLWACQPETRENDAAVNPPQTALPEAPLPDGGAPTVLPPTNDTPTPADEPKDNPVAHGPATDYRSEMQLTGTEPFWGVRIGDKITLMRPDHADLVVANAGPTINGDVAVWNARGLTIRLEPQAGCSDGMSDHRYPYAAMVTVDGEVLKGCAARADQWPRGGG
ncbi:MAG TPA: hypothetical protein VK943_20400 [Arenibaculum sp.]|nr:hypothetical protein [Arenibaculum sp.]